MNKETKDFIAMMKQYRDNNLGLKEIGKQIEKLINLLKFNDANGKTFRALIGNRPVSGKIRVYDERVFLCQNTAVGTPIPDALKFGFKYSYCIGSGSTKDVEDSGVTKLEIIEPISTPEPKKEKDFEVHDVLKFPDGELQTIVAKMGDLVFTVVNKGTSDEEVCGPYTTRELKNLGVVIMPGVEIVMFDAPTFNAFIQGKESVYDAKITIIRMAARLFENKVISLDKLTKILQDIASIN